MENGMAVVELTYTEVVDDDGECPKKWAKNQGGP